MLIQAVCGVLQVPLFYDSCNEVYKKVAGSQSLFITMLYERAKSPFENGLFVCKVFNWF
jgi:hypothetical protein